MAIVIAGVIGGIVVGGGVIAAAVHEDYSDYSDHSDYSDAAERRKAKQKAKAEMQAAVRKEAICELDRVIKRNVESFQNVHDVELDCIVMSANCGFKSFKNDMKPMDESARKAIKEQVETDLQNDILEQKKRLQEVNSLVVAINKKILNKNN